MRRNIFATLLLATTALTSALAQTEPTVYRLVLPRGKGAVAVHAGDGWKLGKASTFPDGQRSVMQTYNPALDITESVSIFPTLTPDVSGEACRQTIFTPSLEDITHRATIQDITRSTYTTKDGRTLATASYIITKVGDDPIHQLSLSAYIGGAQLCAEMHLSKAHFQPADLAAFHAEFDRFRLDLNYVPDLQDYLIAADLYSVDARENSNAALYDRAALYYTGALNAMPADEHSTRQRLVISRLADSWLQSGDTQRARTVYETALTKDPNYPEYDFGLARLDADEDKAAAAKTHLEDAFKHRANLPPGARLPDPTQDPSLLKLKSDKAFWDFVLTLPRD
jgi:hypothetical protein